MDFETTFKSVRGNLLSLSRNHSMMSGNLIDTDDFYSEGCKIFIKCFNRFDERKACFNTYFQSSCKSFFRGMIVKETIRALNHVSTKRLDSQKPDQEHRVTFMDAIASLSNDAVEIVSLVLKTPSDFVDELSKSTIRKWFIQQWGGEGAQDRVKYAFAEIRQTLRDF